MVTLVRVAFRRFVERDMADASASERMGVQSENSHGQDERMHILRLPEELIAVVRPCHASAIADPCSPPTLPATHAGLPHALLA